jgi:hypothetical protein
VLVEAVEQTDTEKDALLHNDKVSEKAPLPVKDKDPALDVDPLGLDGVDPETEKDPDCDAVELPDKCAVAETVTLEGEDELLPVADAEAKELPLE